MLKLFHTGTLRSLAPHLLRCHSTMSSHTPLIKAAEAFVGAEMAGNDGSHDMAHVNRVRDLALRLARDPTSDVSSDDNDSMLIVELAALLHDVKDHKYSGCECEY